MMDNNILFLLSYLVEKRAWLGNKKETIERMIGVKKIIYD